MSDMARIDDLRKRRKERDEKTLREIKEGKYWWWQEDHGGVSKIEDKSWNKVSETRFTWNRNTGDPKWDLRFDFSTISDAADAACKCIWDFEAEEQFDFLLMRSGQRWVRGYRSSRSLHSPIRAEYRPGTVVTAFPWLDTSDLSCQPGIYLCPTEEEALAWSDDIVDVLTLDYLIHEAGGKYRTEWVVVESPDGGSDEG